MMHKFIIGIVILLALVVGALVLAIMNVNGLLEENHDRLSELASEAVGRAVHFEKAEVAFSSGLAVRIDGLRIAEDPRFGESDFVVLDAAFVAVEIWPALQRRLEISGVRLDRPTIRVIQTAGGFNFSSLGASEEGVDSKQAESPPGPEEAGNLAVAIAAFAISQGTVVVEDRSADPPLALTIEEFESSGTDFSLDGPIDIAFSGRIRPTTGHASTASRIRGRIEIHDLESGAGRLRLSSPDFRPGLLGVELEEGDIAERLEDLDLDLGLPADAVSTGYPIALRASAGRLGGFDFADLDAKLRYRGSTAEIERVVVGLAGGSVELAGKMTFGEPGRSPFELDTKLEDLDADELASILLDLPRGLVSGRIGGDVTLSGESLEWETLKRSLAGAIQLEIGKGALENVNLLDRLVAQLVADPGLGQLAAMSIRDVAPASLQGDRTPFDNVNLAFTVANGALNVEALELKTRDFLVSGLGTLGLDGSISMDGGILFSEALSQKILAKADRLAPLLAEGDRVEFPLLLGGSVHSPRLEPDLTALVERARSDASGQLRQEASRELSDALFGKKKERAEGEPADQRERDREAAEALLEEGLGKLFGN
jgi:uncharacterized protein involved in outer membrane biogenesis